MKSIYDKEILNPFRKKTFQPSFKQKNPLLKKPYNINISFNINPKNIINQQIDKLYNISKEEYTQLYHLKEANNKRGKTYNKFDCYMESQSISKINSKAKKAPLIEKMSPNSKKTKPFSKDKNKSSQTILKEKFQKLNKMKKSLLQKIGSLDITLTNQNENQTDLHNNEKEQHNIKNKNQDYLQRFQLAQSLQVQNSSNIKQNWNKFAKNQEQDLITQKLSEYHPDQLISFQNEKSEREDHNNLDISDTFPILFENSLAIKREYEKNYNKNFSNQNQSKSRYKKNVSKKNKKSSQIKAPNSVRLCYQTGYSKKDKAKTDYNNIFNKIKVMHQKLLSSQSFKNLYKSTQFNDEDQQRRKQFIVKTQNEFQNLKDQIQFYCQQNNTTLESMIKMSKQNQFKQKMNEIIQVNRNSQDLQNQSFRPTQQIIESYVSQLTERLQMIKLNQKIRQRKIQIHQEESPDVISQNEKKKKFQQNYIFQSNIIDVLQVKNQQKNLINKKQLNLEISKQLQKSTSSNYQKQSQKSDFSFTFALKQAQLINQQQNKKDSTSSNPYYSLAYSQDCLDYVKKMSSKNSQLDNYFQQYEVYLKKIKSCEQKKQSQNQYNQTLQLNQMSENSEVDSFIYGRNQKDQSLPDQLQKIQNSQDQQINKRLNKISIQKKMREDLQMRLINLKKQKQRKNQNQNKQISLTSNIQKVLREEKQVNNQESLNILMNLIKKQLSKDKTNDKIQQNSKNIIQVVCGQLQSIYEGMKTQQIQAQAQEIYQNTDNSYQNQFYEDKEQLNSNDQEFKTPIKKQQKGFKQKSKKHMRNLSTQNRYTKSEDNDLTLWDLQLLQSSLNRRYRDLTINKQKIYEEIAADETLDNQSFTKKMLDLKKWQRQNKAAILKTKIKINQNMKQYIKIINQDLEESLTPLISKSFSQQNIKQFNFYKQRNLGYKNLLIRDQESKLLNQKIKQNKLIIFKKQDMFFPNKSNSSENSEQEQQKQIEQFKRLKEKHYKTFKEDQSRSQSNSSSIIENNQYEFDQNDSDEQNIIKLQLEKEHFAQLMNRPLFKLHQTKIDDFIERENINEVEINQLQLKIGQRRVSEQQKLDIFQFIFLDLCIQLYQDTIDYEQRQAHRGKINSGAHRILDSILKYLKSEKKKPKKKGPKIGIYTGLNTVKEYLQKLSVFIMSYEQKNKNSLLMERLNFPLGPTAFDLLKSMRFNVQYDNSEQRQEDFQAQAINSLVLPIYAFTQFQSKTQTQKQFQFQKYFEDQQKQKNRLIFLKNMTHVHHKAIFDSLNEILDFERPFGIWGKPFPWKKKTKQTVKNQQELNISLKKSCQKVNQCAMYMCGLLVDKEQSLVKDANISPTYLEEVKQDRMSKLIINDFIQNQNRWFFLDDQQTQVLLQVSYIIWIVMLQEVLKEIKPIFLRQIQSQ